MDENQFQVLREDIRGIHVRLDKLNERTRKSEQEIAVLKASEAKSADPIARWGAVGALLAGAASWWANKTP